MLIFDLDGTISDPAEGFANAINHALTLHGHAPIAIADAARHIGPPLEHTLGTLSGSNSPAHVDGLVAAYRAHYGTVGFRQNVLYPGITDALATLAKAGARMGVCTSKRRDFAVAILELFHLTDLFGFVSGGDVGVSKRTQLGDLLAAGVIDDTAIMIGDREVDISAARANGLRAAGVQWGHAAPGELAQANPQFLLSRPDELIQFADAL